MLEKIEGIIIKTQDYGETHKLVTIFSGNAGKFTAIARGAKKPKSRMAAVTQPFIYGQFIAYISKGLSTIQQGEIIDSFRGIREDIIKTAYIAYIAELTDKLVENNIQVPYIFEQLFETMHWISNHEETEIDIPIMMYEFKLFHIGGFAPVIDRCIRCGSKEMPYAFSIAEGGLLCTKCRSIDPESVHLANPISKVLNIMLKADIQQIGNISMKKENVQLLRKLIDAYYDQYGGFYLKSRRFLSQMHLLR